MVDDRDQTRESKTNKFSGKNRALLFMYLEEIRSEPWPGRFEELPRRTSGQFLRQNLGQLPSHRRTRETRLPVPPRLSRSQTRFANFGRSSLTRLGFSGKKRRTSLGVSSRIIDGRTFETDFLFESPRTARVTRDRRYENRERMTPRDSGERPGECRRSKN